jgi:hypothetical protein
VDRSQFAANPLERAEQRFLALSHASRSPPARDQQRTRRDQAGDEYADHRPADQEPDESAGQHASDGTQHHHRVGSPGQVGLGQQQVQPAK